MFTDVAHHHPTHRFPHSSQYYDQYNYDNSVSTTLLPNIAQRDRHYALRSGGYRQRSQKHQHHARQLQSPFSLYRQEPIHDTLKPIQEISEHMLRRKTPNGTLAAGYDGRPVESTARSRATKHILMPVSNANHPSPTAEVLRDKSIHPKGQAFVGPDNSQRQMWQGIAVERNRREARIPASNIKSNLPMLAGLDSVLNQGSSFPYHGKLAGELKAPTALQPMWPPDLGPTSMKNSGFYEPSWPDGIYAPHQPVPTQDLHYPREAGEAIATGIALQQPDFNDRRQLNAENSRDNFQLDSTQVGPKASPSCGFVDSNLGSERVREQAVLGGQDLYMPQHLQVFLAPHCKPQLSREFDDRSNNFWDSPPQSSTFSRSMLHEAALPMPNSQPGHTQFKEKVLIWAHRIYSSLVAAMQHSRRNLSDHHQGGRQLQSTTYPKPPRQSFVSLSRDYNLASLDKSIPCLQVSPFQEVGETNLRSEEYCHWLAGTQVGSSNGHAISAQSPFGVLPRQDHHLRQSLPSTKRQISSPHTMLPSCPDVPSDFAMTQTTLQQETSPSRAAITAIEMLDRLCQESSWEWIDGIMLGGCLAYGLGDYSRAMKWYIKALSCDPNNVEAMSNLAATLLSLNRRAEAEQQWLRAVKFRPAYFDAVEHLIGLLGEDDRKREAIIIIEFVENALRNEYDNSLVVPLEFSPTSVEESLSPCISVAERSDNGISDLESNFDGGKLLNPRWASTNLSSNGYNIPPSENGRMLAIIHAKGNMLYQLGDNAGAARAFEDAILLGAGRRQQGICGLIKQILRVFSDRARNEGILMAEETLLLLPEMALETSYLLFPSKGQLPGLNDVAKGVATRAAIAVVSNSLLSLAKIYQDGMSSSGASAGGLRATCGVQEILALYYLSLSLQPSPSTANNVGILLASVQQSNTSHVRLASKRLQCPVIPGVEAGSGVALALAYYNYGLNLDSRHAHLYTNLGSLFKDIGQLNAAIKMYEKAVECDGQFDIALANLANAVKDQGRISDAISYYRRAVSSNPDFAEAVCGLANALNSVCSWSGRGGISHGGSRRDRWHVDDEGMLYDPKISRSSSNGWIQRVVSIVEKQLHDGEGWGKGILRSLDGENLLKRLGLAYNNEGLQDQTLLTMKDALESWMEKPWEGAKVVRLVERATKWLGWQWYQNKHIQKKPCSTFNLMRPQLPAALAVPAAPTVLPFHTFTCPLSAQQIRRISQRNGLRISCSTLRAPWLPTRIYEPPSPPNPHFNVGYVSSDFNNHPLAHLMQSVFGFHNKARFRAFCYATTASDASIHRRQIEQEAPHFYDASSWSIERLVNQIVKDGIHILVNLNGYTRGARNEVFAARPAPIQMSFMGFAGTLGAEWCDYLLADKIAVPPQTLRPWRRNVDLVDQTIDENNEDDLGEWVYGENLIFTRDTFFCCDHRQSAPDSQDVQLSWVDEQSRRWRMRRELFPDLADDTVILGNFNQLYKIEPTTFRTWLRILSRIPHAVLWLLRFPDLGESNLKQTALLWVGSEVASRIIFTDVAPKNQHISRARICDLFLDTPECNAHTTAADVLWSGTPLLTFPRYEYKMCSRIAASILRGALPKTADGDRAMEELVAQSDEDYEERAVRLGLGLIYPVRNGPPGHGTGRLVEFRKLLYESRWESALFDTRRWVRDLEMAYLEAWTRWVAGRGGDIWL